MFSLSVSGGAAGGDAWGRVGIFMAEADSAQDIGGFGRGTGVADCVRGGVRRTIQDAVPGDSMGVV